MDEFEFHMCPNKDYAWGHIPRTAYAEHSQDTCPESGACRFLPGTLRPAKVRPRFAELIPAYRATPLSGPTVDDGDATTGSLLLGKGKPVTRQEWAATVNRVEAFITREAPDGWATPLQAAGLVMFQHSHADIRRREMVQSEAHTAAISRVSYFVQIHFQDGDRQPDSLHIAAVMRYVRVQQAGSGSWLRLAICRVWKASRKHAGLLACNEAMPRFQEIAVDVNSIDRKLIKAASVRGPQRMHFMPYSKTSNMG